MQLVELETQGGKKIWLNPEHVVTAATNQNSGTLTDVCVIGTDPKHPVTLKGALADVVKKINDGLKA